MAGRITLWGAGEILNAFFCHAENVPQAFYLAVCLDAAPTPYVSGAELDEPEVVGYSRLAIPATTGYWSNSGQPQVISTTQDLSFPTATTAWGTVRYWALCNAPVDGYVYAVGDMLSVNVTVGSQLQLFSGDLSFSMGPFYSEES